MPVYEYACPKCGRHFEKLVFRSAEAVACPDCGATEVHRRLSSFSVGRSLPSAPCGEFPAGGCGSCCSGGPGGCAMD